MTISYPWGNNLRFNSYTEYFKKEFGGRVQKLALDAGFSCPNRDGNLSFGGCTYCNNNAFNPSYCNPSKSITLQIKEGIEFHKVRYRRADKYLAYFQAYSNTYAPITKLKELYEEALNYPGIIGLVIGTRPDCIDDEKLKYISELAKKYYIIIEYGIESVYNNSLKKINRGHTYEQSESAIFKTAGYGIKTGAHLIFGLPGESMEEMLAETAIISRLPLHTLKFHQLQIIRNTIMAKDYKNNKSGFTFFNIEDYIDFVINFIERLNPAFIIERISAEVPPRFLAGKGWGLIRSDQVLQLFYKKLEERNTWQGRLY